MQFCWVLRHAQADNLTSVAIFSIEHFILTPFCQYLIVKCSAFRFFLPKQGFFYLKYLL